MTAIEQISNPPPAIETAEPETPAPKCGPHDPISIYQVDLASWMRVPEEQNRSLTSSEIAPKLADYARCMGFTHVQIRLPAPATPEELECLAGYLQQQGVGVIFENAAFDSSFADGQCSDGESVLSDCRYQWDETWTAETLAYFSLDSPQRRILPNVFARGDSYAFKANYILPLSARLANRPRQSLYALMPGDTWQKFANLRLLFACQYLFPGKKLVFMGNEFGQENPWRPETSLDWHLVNNSTYHGKLQEWVKHLNRFYSGEAALHETDSEASGFQWVNSDDAASSIISFLRRDLDAREALLVVLNFTPATHHNYRVGAPQGGNWSEMLNSDALEFGGSGQGNLGGVEAAPFGWNFQSHSLMLTVPPLGALVLKANRDALVESRIV